MTLTHQDIVTADLYSLTDAAKAWKGMGERFGELKQNYRKHIPNALANGSWQGQAFDAHQGSAQRTIYEYAAAKKEAQAVATILTDAHTELTRLQKAVKDLVADAESKDYRVDSHGKATYVGYDKLSAQEQNAARHDPDYWPTVRKHEAEFTEEIAKAVRAVDDADQGVKLALTTAVRDTSGDGSGFGGFNAHAESDTEKAEGRRAAELGMKLNSGEDLSTREAAELRRLLRDNEHDQTFSRTMLTELGGPSGLIKLTNKLNHEMEYGDSAGQRKAYGAIEEGLATALDTATSGPKDTFYTEYVDGLKEAGRRNFGSNADPHYGYQTLTGLMRQGGKYDTDLLTTLGSDIVAYEKEKGTGMWTAYNGGHPGSEHDPLDGMLGVMGKNPEAATEFLDPRRGDNLEYLMKEREWPGSVMNGPGMVKELDDPSQYAGFGEAMDAATQDIPGSDFEAHDRIINEAVGHVADQGDDFPPGMREPMAQALANQRDDVYQTLGTIGRDGDPLSEDELFETAKQIQRDPEAGKVLNLGLVPEMIEDVNANHSDEKDSNALLRSGRTVGVLEQAQSQAMKLENPEAQLGEWKTALDVGIGHIPVVGGEVQAGVDLVADKWLQGENARVTDIEKGELKDGYTYRNEQLNALADQWSIAHRGDPDATEDIWEIANRAASDGYTDSHVWSGASADSTD
ncbi:DUF6571 family protein [Streptomyces boninensis]|uniref:DUF6571 family protein n=1 Tax=Streptomyces boninensis TaxID=2039455 RepID=UPI003B228DCE